jgi:hypothetical protein
VAAREDVLEVSHRPFAPKRPLVGLDAASQHLSGEVAAPVPAEPGQPERIDSEDVRPGTAHLFLICEPRVGWRPVEVTERRTAQDFAEVVRWLVEEVPPEAAKMVWVMDHRNTPKVASLYEAFEPGRGRRIAERGEIPPTPKHGSGRTRAASELSVRTRPGLDRRMGARTELGHEVSAWEGPRNERGVVIRWQFPRADARLKLRRLYPTVQ